MTRKSSVAVYTPQRETGSRDRRRRARARRRGGACRRGPDGIGPGAPADDDDRDDVDGDGDDHHHGDDDGGDDHDRARAEAQTEATAGADDSQRRDHRRDLRRRPFAQHRVPGRPRGVPLTARAHPRRAPGGDLAAPARRHRVREGRGRPRAERGARDERPAGDQRPRPRGPGLRRLPRGEVRPRPGRLQAHPPGPEAVHHQGRAGEDPRPEAGFRRHPRGASGQPADGGRPAVQGRRAEGHSRQLRPGDRDPPRGEPPLPVHGHEAVAHLHRRDRPVDLPDAARQVPDRREVEGPVVVPAELAVGKGRETDSAGAGQPARHPLDGAVGAGRRDPRDAGPRLARLLGLSRVHPHVHPVRRMAVRPRGDRDAGLHRPRLTRRCRRG